MFWPGLVRSGLVWPGLFQSVTIRSVLAWPGLVWSNLSVLVCSGLAWSGLVWSGLVCSDPIRSGLAWSGLAFSTLFQSGLVRVFWSGQAWSGLSEACARGRVQLTSCGDLVVSCVGNQAAKPLLRLSGCLFFASEKKRFFCLTLIGHYRRTNGLFGQLSLASHCVCVRLCVCVRERERDKEHAK